MSEFRFINFLLVATFFVSCVAIERNNPDDPGSINYDPNSAVPSSNSKLSSSSQTGIIPETPVDYKSETYETVRIGAQIWMAKNLNYAVEGSRCYNDLESNCTIYGRLYDWNTAMSICPEGWRLPSGEDWNVLMKFLNPNCSDYNDCNKAGTKLKATSDWNVAKGIPTGTDNFGFAALPGGILKSDGNFYDVGDFGCWWSSTESSSANAYSRCMENANEFVSWAYGTKYALESVRCVRDYVPKSSAYSSSGIASSSSSVEEREHYGKMKSQFVDARDGKKYVYVEMGANIWMAENLNYNANGSKCYNDLESNCTTYGRLYSWSTAMSVCPSGWHLPLETDWNALMKFVNPSCSANSECGIAGTKLKSASHWNDYEGNSGNGKDDYGFTALPGGGGGFSSGFEFLGEYGIWWSASEYNTTDAYYRGMYNSNEFVSRYNFGKITLFSVRCVKD